MRDALPGVGLAMPWMKWDGGRYWLNDIGHRTYYLRRTVGGIRYDVNTGATTDRGALEQLKRFEADPSAYHPAGPHREPLRLTPVLIDQFVLFSEVEKRNSKPWVRRQRKWLNWWAGLLKGTDLRQVKLGEHVVPALDSVKLGGRRARVATLKAFYSWLQKRRHAISAVENPVASYAIAQSTPKQWTVTRVIPEVDHTATLLAIRPHWIPHVILLHGVGLHISELLRFARAGEIHEDGTGGAVLTFLHKSGRPHLTRIEPHLLQHAQAVRKGGGFSESRLYRAIRDACGKAGVPRFGPGSYRHTFATRKTIEGAFVQSVSDYMGHQSAQTTKRFYATLAAPPIPRGPGSAPPPVVGQAPAA